MNGIKSSRKCEKTNKGLYSSYLLEYLSQRYVPGGLLCECICWCMEDLLLGFCLIHSIPFIFLTLHKQATIHQVTTMLATSENVLFPGHITTMLTKLPVGMDDPTL